MKDGQDNSAAVATEWKLVRYCPECGSVGEVGNGFIDCCPDGNHAVRVPQKIAEQAHAGFAAAPTPPNEDELVRLLQRVHARLLKAQIFDLATEVSKAIAGRVAHEDELVKALEDAHEALISAGNSFLESTHSDDFGYVETFTDATHSKLEQAIASIGDALANYRARKGEQG